MRQTDTRQLLIHEGLKSFMDRGYDGVGIGPVLAAVQVPKGSFYYFFRSKEDFAAAVLEAYVARYAVLRESLQTESNLPALGRLRSHFDALEKELTAQYPAGGCLYGVLSQTITALGPKLRRQVHDSFKRWEKSLLQVLLQAQDKGELDPGVNAGETAAFLIDAYEGALVRMKTEGVAGPFSRFRKFALEPLLAGGIGARARKPKTRTKVCSGDRR